jgi:hypothetical protein
MIVQGLLKHVHSANQTEKKYDHIKEKEQTGWLGIRIMCQTVVSVS